MSYSLWENTSELTEKMFCRHRQNGGGEKEKKRG